MTTILKSAEEWRRIRKAEISVDMQIGFVPTMGALHAGHESLFKRSVDENEITVVSIFVNPTQFNDLNDLKNYPKIIEKDIEILKKNKVDYLFLPLYEELYSDNYAFRVIENNFSKTLCGAFRPNHFDGVLTIVMKLLNIILPIRAYFGEKDFQQFTLIKEMCKTFFMDVEIISSPTVRESDGLAMSSRNLLLTKEERVHAVNFPKLLMTSKTDQEIIGKLEELGFRVDYVETIAERRFGAVHLGKVRLIDNVQI